MSTSLRLHDTNTTSPVLHLLTTLAVHRRRQAKADFAAAFESALDAAIRGLVWGKQDWTYVVALFGAPRRTLFGDCVPVGGTQDERWFTRMVLHDNNSAAASFETYVGRGAFRDGKTGQRLYVGSTLVGYNGNDRVQGPLKVTSFHPRDEAHPDGYVVALRPVSGGSGGVRLDYGGSKTGFLTVFFPAAKG